MTNQSTRRRFMKSAVSLGVSAAAVTRLAPPSALGANDKIRIGGIGVGDRGSDRLRTAMRLGADIVALADVNDAMIDRCEERLQKKTDRYRDYQDLLARDDIDAVILAGPDHWHHDLLMDSLAAKKDAYTEKPFSRTIEQGREMVKAVEASNQIVQVGNQRRSGGHWKHAHDVVAAGAIGEIKWVRTWDCRYRLVDPYQERAKDPVLYNPDRIDWKRFLGSAPDRPFDAERCSAWRWFWDYAGGLMTDIGPHMLDVVMWVTESVGPVRVACNGGNYHYPRWETPDNVHSILDCSTFAIVFDVQFMNGYEGDGAAFYGTEGSLIQERDGWFRVYDLDNKKVDEWERGDEGTAHMQNFLDCIRSREQPNSPAAMGHKVIIGAHLSNMSYREGKRVEWDPVKEKLI
ncbi:MAG: hypothetical protein GC154_19065 [bacterium]|nr:hypothetical protein [bacterium]